jgi:gamma-glutamylaminecyclotransferase
MSSSPDLARGQGRFALGARTDSFPPPAPGAAEEQRQADPPTERQKQRGAALVADEKTEWVFVYGTLRKGQPNHEVLATSTYIGEFRTTTAYPLVVSTAYFGPVLLDIPGTGSSVSGEVYAVTAATLATLDKLENADGVHYTRRAVKIARSSDPSATASAYVYLKCEYQDDLLTKLPPVDAAHTMPYVPRHRRPLG